MLFIQKEVYLIQLKSYKFIDPFFVDSAVRILFFNNLLTC